MHAQPLYPTLKEVWIAVAMPRCMPDLGQQRGIQEQKGLPGHLHAPRCNDGCRGGAPGLCRIPGACFLINFCQWKGSRKQGIGLSELASNRSVSHKDMGPYLTSYSESQNGSNRIISECWEERSHHCSPSGCIWIMEPWLLQGRLAKALWLVSCARPPQTHSVLMLKCQAQDTPLLLCCMPSVLFHADTFLAQVLCNTPPVGATVPERPASCDEWPIGDG
eukprot:414152-Pelagomonas_calceolata.AAC.4